MDQEKYKEFLKQIKIGKHLPDSIYIHASAIKYLQTELTNFLNEKIVELGLEGTSWNVIKLFTRDFKISLLDYPEFFDSEFPRLKSSCSIDMAQSTYKKIQYKEKGNPPILHRKETLLHPSSPLVQVYSKLTIQAENEGLFQNKSSIGFKKAWEKLLTEKGLSIKDHEIIKADVLDGRIDRHKTAIDRNSLSTPVQSLYRHNYLNGDYTLFDYGCGKGDDLNIVKELGVKATGWDPVYYSLEQINKADIVNLGFVINIIESPKERILTLNKAFSLSKKFLVVSVMLGSESITGKFKQYGDGVVTSRNTFQKYYTQNEFREFLESSLEESAIAVGPGLFYIFKDKIEEQQFLIERQRRRKNWKKISYTGSPERLEIKQKAFYHRYNEILDDFWNICLEFGRLPFNSEYQRSEELRAICGSHQKAFKLVSGIHDKSDFETAVYSRRNDLLVHIALGLFSRRKPYKSMPKTFQKDITHYFDKYTDAIQEATDLLFSVGKTQTIKIECQKAYELLKIGHMEGDHSWTIHTDYINQLTPVLRTYIGCATQLYGDLDEVDLIKIHMQSNKVSLMKFDDFENKPLPLLMERIKINLREQRIDFYTYGEKFKSQPLYLKSKFIDEGFPNFELQVSFDEQLKSMEWIDLGSYGPNVMELEAGLSERNLIIDEFLIKAKK